MSTLEKLVTMFQPVHPTYFVPMAKLCKEECIEDEYMYTDVPVLGPFTPSPDPNPKHPRVKHQEFVEYFKNGVKNAYITSKVCFQERVYITPGCGDDRKYCVPDVVFTKGGRAAIVQMRNYEQTPLRRRDVDKILKDMCALKHSNLSTSVSGYIYMRNCTVIDLTWDDYIYARMNGIRIVRDGVVLAHVLAQLVDYCL